MNNAAQVDLMVAEWKAAGDTKVAICVKAADACLGWSYVWGGAGQYCTTANRKSYAERSSCPSGESAQIVKKCQVLNGSKGSCAGCKYYPGGAKTRFFDCRGFTRWIIQRVGVTIQGAGATSQYNDNSNWTQKGSIADMPDVFCCVFMHNTKTGKMEHTGLHVGGGRIVHCSGEVKEDSISNKHWTHYAIPKGVDGDVPPEPVTKPTLRRGDRGSYVTLAQTELINKGYSCGDKGADGIFGRATEDAVKAMQKDYGLKVDGIIGKDSWAVLDSTEPAKLYTVTIPHLTESQAESLTSQYPGSTKTEERGITAL